MPGREGVPWVQQWLAAVQEPGRQRLVRQRRGLYQAGNGRALAQARRAPLPGALAGSARCMPSLVLPPQAPWLTWRGIAIRAHSLKGFVQVAHATQTVPSIASTLSVCMRCTLLVYSDSNSYCASYDSSLGGASEIDLRLCMPTSIYALFRYRAAQNTRAAHAHICSSRWCHLRMVSPKQGQSNHLAF